ncbi:hypothetical protein GLAREA_12748 [Glarea lozoyensis ATCC 20868]|uniref:Uncharacterized protein n=1 Tax=Glarea lozoyensis (strain ATCC 20868 / MF5171) TaxID=1116229 RepID=S3D0R6_GLAL2|nr:uncharacterized protein GLAREA_12748 [Glarea lozoyensis ATCC 20868]EPE31445.1 hypothetical protein GLAREA_12748 [Glarea lozoyensis ATCC 20868]
MTSEENKIKAMERSKMNCEDPKLAKEEITQAMAASRKIRPNLISTGGDNEDGAASLVDNRNPPDMISYLLKPEDIPSAVFPARYELEATFTPENADEEFPTTLPELAKSIYQHYEWRRLFPANRAKYALPKTAESSFITVFKTREQAEGEIRIFGADRGDDEGAWFIYQLSMEAVKKPMVLEGEASYDILMEAGYPEENIVDRGDTVASFLVWHGIAQAKINQKWEVTPQRLWELGLNNENCLLVRSGIEIGALKVAESRGVVVLKRYADGLRTESPPKIVEQADDKKAKRAKETVVMREILAHTPTAASRPDRVQQYLVCWEEDSGRRTTS